MDRRLETGGDPTSAASATPVAAHAARAMRCRLRRSSETLRRAAVAAVHVPKAGEFAASHRAADGEAAGGAATEVHATCVLVRTEAVPLTQVPDVLLQAADNLRQ